MLLPGGARSDTTVLLTGWINERDARTKHIRKEGQRAMNYREGSYRLSHAYDRLLDTTVTYTAPRTRRIKFLLVIIVGCKLKCKVCQSFNYNYCTQLLVMGKCLLSLRQYPLVSTTKPTNAV